MENYAVNLEKNLGKKAGDTIVNTLAEKAKASIQAERVVLISVENEDGSTDSFSTGAPLDILGRLGMLTLEIIKNIERNSDKHFADVALDGFIGALKDIQERR